MSYMNCPTCGFSFRMRAPSIALEPCPRCLAHEHVVSEMYVSQAPGGKSEERDGCAQSISSQPFEYPREVREIGGPGPGEA